MFLATVFVVCSCLVGSSHHHYVPHHHHDKQMWPQQDAGLWQDDHQDDMCQALKESTDILVGSGAVSCETLPQQFPGKQFTCSTVFNSTFSEKIKSFCLTSGVELYQSCSQSSVQDSRSCLTELIDVSNCLTPLSKSEVIFIEIVRVSSLGCLCLSWSARITLQCLDQVLSPLFRQPLIETVSGVLGQ